MPVDGVADSCGIRTLSRLHGLWRGAVSSSPRATWLSGEGCYR
jgi:hypothetical protein